MNMSSFTWIPFYTELAGKLLQYKNRREDLAKLIYSNFEKKEIKFLHDYDGSDFKELDPFTVYSVFNRSMKNRIGLTQKIKELFGLKAMVPNDFDGIPVQSPMNASYITYSEDRSPDGKDVDRLWKLFEQAQDEKSNLSKVFDAVLMQRSIAIPKLTMGLYYICPNRFLALDGNNRGYLEHYGFDDWDFLHLKYSDYSELLELVREKMKKKEIMETSFPEFSANAYAGGRDAIIDYYSNPFQVYINLLKANRNIILTGAPGTGKTYLAKAIAEEMDAEVGFVQFHPSYDYTDFVEGLRPKNDDNGNVGFERRDGVFKEFCKRALKASFVNTVDNFDSVWNQLIKTLEENDFIEIPLISGKYAMRIELNEDGDGLANRTYDNDKYERGKWIRGQSKFFSKEQCYNVYRGLNGVPSGGHDTYRKAVVRYMKDKMGLLDYKVGNENTLRSKPFVFIIDEINRGEISKIFGELFFSIDPGYRGEKGMVQTQYQNMIKDVDAFKKGFYVPENVYIIGTMNDIDRSVESMDFAMRRRFAWKEVTAEESYEAMKDKMVHAEEVKTRMTALNNAICDEKLGLNKSYQIGAAYFLKLDKYDGDFDKLWEYHLRGLLSEYLRGNRDAEKQLEQLKKAYDGNTESQNE